MVGSNIYKKNIILFGASKAGEKAYKILKEFNLSIKYFVDNDSNKHDKMLFDKKIYNSEKIFNMNKNEDIIVISSMYVGEISEQLNKMGFEGFYYDIHDFIYGLVKSFKDKFGKLNEEINSKRIQKYLITLPKGVILGGLEVWSLNTYNLLLKENKDATLLSLSDGKRTDLILSDKNNYSMVDIPQDGTNYLEYLNLIIRKIDDLKPSVVVPNVSEDVYLACHILKKRYGREFIVVSVLHSDIDFSYIQNLRYESIIDKFICVSDRIKDKLVRRLSSREKDIYTLLTPIKHETYTRTYSDKNEPIKLGYVGRLVKPDKRADLLISLISNMEKTGIKYNFDIVGEGDFSEVINKFIKNKTLKGKIRLLGGIPNHLIYDFWREKDIFINVSDLEGTSISMLEGLYNGAVPVLTDVSGVRKFVEHGENGFIVNTGDIDSMTKYILYLNENRGLLKKYGRKVHEKVSEICNPDKYIREFIRICEVD